MKPAQPVAEDSYLAARYGDDLDAAVPAGKLCTM